MGTPGDVNAVRTRHSRYLVECYSDPLQFGTQEEYVQALGEALDELTTAWGAPLPDLEKAISAWQTT